MIAFAAEKGAVSKESMALWQLRVAVYQHEGNKTKTSLSTSLHSSLLHCGGQSSRARKLWFWVENYLIHSLVFVRNGTRNEHSFTTPALGNGMVGTQMFGLTCGCFLSAMYTRHYMQLSIRGRSVVSFFFLLPIVWLAFARKGIA